MQLALSSRDPRDSPSSPTRRSPDRGPQPEAPDEVTAGAPISSDFHPAASTHVTNNRFPASYGFMRWYLAPLVDSASRAERARGTIAAMQIGRAHV